MERESVRPIGASRWAFRFWPTTMPRMKCASGRTDPDLWEQSKAEAIEKMGGRHSARAMQEAGRIYREAGGEYCGPRTKLQRRLKKWTQEDWRTYTGEKACRGSRCDRYLPAAAWESLSPQEVAATRGRKLRARRQYVPNAPAAREAGRRARSKPVSGLASAALLKWALFAAIVPGGILLALAANRK
jgi:hypothetical protein